MVVCFFFLSHVCSLSIVILFVFFPGAVRLNTVFWGCNWSTLHQHVLLLIPKFCPGGQRLTCGPTISTNQMRPWD